MAGYPCPDLERLRSVGEFGERHAGFRFQRFKGPNPPLSVPFSEICRYKEPRAYPSQTEVNALVRLDALGSGRGDVPAFGTGNARESLLKRAVFRFADGKCTGDEEPWRDAGADARGGTGRPGAARQRPTPPGSVQVLELGRLVGAVEVHCTVNGQHITGQLEQVGLAFGSPDDCLGLQVAQPLGDSALGQ